MEWLICFLGIHFRRFEDDEHFNCGERYVFWICLKCRYQDSMKIG